MTDPPLADTAFLTAADLVRDEADDRLEVGPLLLVRDGDCYEVLYSDGQILISTEVIRPTAFASARDLAGHLMMIEEVSRREAEPGRAEPMILPQKSQRDNTGTDAGTDGSQL